MMIWNKECSGGFQILKILEIESTVLGLQLELSEKRFYFSTHLFELFNFVDKC